MAGPFDFLHMKGRTPGSPNEVSFDVLDAARHGLDASQKKKKRAWRDSSGPKPSQGSYHGVAGTSTLSAVPEVERRKRARRSHAIRFRVLAVLVIGAICVGVGYASLSFYEDTVDFSTHVEALVGKIAEVDKSIVLVDDFMSRPMNPLEEDARNQVVQRFNGIEADLQSIAEEARSMTVDSTSDSASEALAQIELAVDARIDMLSAARDAFALSLVANRQVVAANEAWNKVVEADAKAREATMLANAASTEEATVEAQSLTQEAFDELKEARIELVTVERGVAGISYQEELAYIDKRMEALQAAIATADALLAGDRSEAERQNDAYNAADQVAANLATILPSSLDERVRKQYAESMQSCLDTYDAARSSAATADSALRRFIAS